MYKCLVLSFIFLATISAEESFILLDKSGSVLKKMGAHLEERITPCSTFKIALSLMGFDSGILKNEKEPVWLFQDGFDDYLESWKSPQNPESWMSTSCVWFSRKLSLNLGMDQLNHYLEILNYGNQNMSGGLTNAWLSSSLQISPREQAIFIQRLVQEDFLLSLDAIRMTKQLLFLEEMSNGWKLFGKTGWSGASEPEKGWFIGWLQKGEEFYPFAYINIDKKINLSRRIPRVKELLCGYQG